MKKKKKTKKPDFDMEEAGNGEQAKEEAPAKDADVDNLADNLDDLSFGKKKKKKSKKTFDLDAADAEAAQAGGEPEAGEPSGEKDTGAGEALDEGDLDFNLPKKKKKKKGKITFGEDEVLGEEGQAGDDDQDDSEGKDVPAGTTTAAGATPWSNSDRDYTYEELLQHVFNIIKEKNPDIIAGEKRRLVMRPPQVLRVGTKKSSFANFIDICKSLHRQPKHMQAFLLAELGTSGSVDANNQLIIKGRFQQKQIESVLRRYISELIAVSC